MAEDKIQKDAKDAGQPVEAAESFVEADTEAKAKAQEVEEAEKRIKETLQKIQETATEEDPRPSQQLNLRTILGGDLLTTQMVRSQIWLFVMIVAFSIIYVAFRYQCQQDMITIDKLEGELKNAKYKALSSSSELTEKCRESNVLEMLQNNKDSVLKIPNQPPYIIYTP